MSTSKNRDGLTLEKAKWVEEQINRNLTFRFESSEILRKEAHATLGWLYAIMGGSSAYIVSHLSRDYVWIIVPLGFATIAAMVVAIILLNVALMAKVFPSPGNVPSNIATPEQLKLSEQEMRLCEAEGTEETLRDLEALNRKTGRAINNARIAIAIIPVATLVAILVFFLIID